MPSPWRGRCIFFLTTSIISGIGTLALIPAIAERNVAVCKSIYDYVTINPFSLPGWNMKLWYVCLPQHLLFIFGLVAYAVGTPRGRQNSSNEEIVTTNRGRVTEIHKVPDADPKAGPQSGGSETTGP